MKKKDFKAAVYLILMLPSKPVTPQNHQCPQKVTKDHQRWDAHVWISQGESHCEDKYGARFAKVWHFQLELNLTGILL